MLKKILITLLLFLNLACQDKKQENTLKLAISPDFPPFEFKKDGKLEGFDIELAQMICKKLGKNLEILEFDFNSLIPLLVSGKADFIMSGLTITSEREKNIDFSTIYYKAHIAGLTKDKELKNLEGKRIGAQLGSYMEIFANEQKQLYPNITIISLANNLHLLQELKLGRIDVLLLEEAQIPIFLKNNPELNSVYFVDKESGYAIGFKKGSPLKAEFNKVLAELEADGSIKALRNKWSN